MSKIKEFFYFQLINTKIMIATVISQQEEHAPLKIVQDMCLCILNEI